MPSRMDGPNGSLRPEPETLLAWHRGGRARCGCTRRAHAAAAELLLKVGASSSMEIEGTPSTRLDRRISSAARRNSLPTHAERLTAHPRNVGRAVCVCVCVCARARACVCVRALCVRCLSRALCPRVLMGRCGSGETWVGCAGACGATDSPVGPATCKLTTLSLRCSFAHCRLKRHALAQLNETVNESV